MTNVDYIAGVGEENQFLNRLPDNIGGTGKNPLDILRSPDNLICMYKPSGGVLTPAFRLPTAGLSTLKVVETNNSLIQYIKTIIA